MSLGHSQDHHGGVRGYYQSVQSHGGMSSSHGHGSSSGHEMGFTSHSHSGTGSGSGSGSQGQSSSSHAVRRSPVALAKRPTLIDNSIPDSLAATAIIATTAAAASDGEDRSSDSHHHRSLRGFIGRLRGRSSNVSNMDWNNADNGVGNAETDALNLHRTPSPKMLNPFEGGTFITPPTPEFLSRSASPIPGPSSLLRPAPSSSPLVPAPSVTWDRQNRPSLLDSHDEVFRWPGTSKLTLPTLPSPSPGVEFESPMGLLDPRLEMIRQESKASLGLADHEDYSRPISGVRFLPVIRVVLY